MEVAGSFGRVGGRMPLEASSFLAMDNHLLVEELKAGSPGAVKAIHDSYAHGLFTYCWFMLRNADAAQVAVCDSLVVAQAHIARLTEPELLKPWLYALARVECLRRRPSPASEPGVDTAGRHGQDAGAGLMAWHAVMDLGPLEREALELSTRQRLGLAGVAPVLGIPTKEAELLLIRARESLQRALAGQILARAGADGCADRATILADWDGTLTAPVRERLVSHAAGCTACARHLPRNVSATKVYSLLPVPDPPVEMRHRALACVGDPELAGYRAFVAGRAAKFGRTGFPVTPAAVTPAASVAAAAATEPHRRTSAHLWVGLAAALAATAAGAVVAVSRLGGFDGLFHGRLTGSAGSAGRGAVPAPAAGPGSASGTAHARVQVGRSADHADHADRAAWRGGKPWRATRSRTVGIPIASGPVAAARRCAAAIGGRYEGVVTSARPRGGIRWHADAEHDQGTGRLVGDHVLA